MAALTSPATAAQLASSTTAAAASSVAAPLGSDTAAALADDAADLRMEAVSLMVTAGTIPVKLAAPLTAVADAGLGEVLP